MWMKRCVSDSESTVLRQVRQRWETEIHFDICVFIAFWTTVWAMSNEHGVMCVCEQDSKPENIRFAFVLFASTNKYVRSLCMCVCVWICWKVCFFDNTVYFIVISSFSFSVAVSKRLTKWLWVRSHQNKHEWEKTCTTHTTSAENRNLKHFVCTHYISHNKTLVLSLATDLPNTKHTNQHHSYQRMYVGYDECCLLLLVLVMMVVLLLLGYFGFDYETKQS